MTRYITALFALVLSSAAFAVPVTWEFSGAVIITVNGGSYWTDAGVSIGDRVVGSVTFDPDAAFAAAVTFPLAPALGGGTFIGTPNLGTNPAFADFSPIVISRMGTGLGDLIYEPAPAAALYRERTILDTLFFKDIFNGGAAIDTTSLETYDLVNGVIDLGRFEIFRLADDPGGGAIPNDHFLSAPPALADLLFAIMSIGEYDKTHISSVLTTQLDSVRRVPEPGTLSLLGAGLAGLAYLRRRRTA